MLNCRESTHLISSSRDRTLAVAERLSLEMHLLMCGGCRHYRDQLKFIGRACEQYREELGEDKDAAPPGG